MRSQKNRLIRSVGIAALAAEGESTITGTEYLERGYEDFVGGLKGLGADIKRVVK